MNQNQPNTNTAAAANALTPSGAIALALAHRADSSKMPNATSLRTLVQSSGQDLNGLLQRIEAADKSIATAEQDIEQLRRDRAAMYLEHVQMATAHERALLHWHIQVKKEAEAEDRPWL